jgi:hypothetical protein
LDKILKKLRNCPKKELNFNEKIVLIFLKILAVNKTARLSQKKPICTSQYNDPILDHENRPQ